MPTKFLLPPATAEEAHGQSVLLLSREWHLEPANSEEDDKRYIPYCLTEGSAEIVMYSRHRNGPSPIVLMRVVSAMMAQNGTDKVLLRDVLRGVIDCMAAPIEQLLATDEATTREHLAKLSDLLLNGWAKFHDDPYASDLICGARGWCHGSDASIRGTAVVLLASASPRTTDSGDRAIGDNNAVAHILNITARLLGPEFKGSETLTNVGDLATRSSLCWTCGITMNVPDHFARKYVGRMAEILSMDLAVFLSKSSQIEKDLVGPEDLMLGKWFADLDFPMGVMHDSRFHNLPGRGSNAREVTDSSICIHQLTTKEDYEKLYAQFPQG